MLSLQLAFFVICLVWTAFFSAAETALTSVSLSTWDKLRVEHPEISTAYRLWSGQPSMVLAALLFGNTLSSLGASVSASAAVRHFSNAREWSTGIFILLSSVLAGSTILIIGEILPKLYARHTQESVLVRTAPIWYRMARILSPWLRGLTALSGFVQRLFSHRPPEPLITSDELRQALAESKNDTLGASASRILTNIMDFDRILVRDVMVPRAHMAAVRMEKNSERMFERIVRSGFSRIPVYFGHIDNILGIVYAKDLLVEWRSSGLVVLEDLLRPPYRIAPEAPLSVLLQGFRQGHHLAIVTDALGHTQGMVTIEDAVEAIVGDIADEFDQPSVT